MARIDYEFDHAGEGKSRTGIYVRLVVIFLVVAGLTAGLIYYLIPKSDDGSAVSDPAAHETQLPSAGGETEPPSEAGETPAPGNRPPDGSGETQLPGEAEAETPIENTGTAEEEPKVEEPLPVPADATQTPEKGKPWVGDPIIDRPDVPQTEIPADVRPSLDADFNRAEKSLAEKNYPDAAAAAGNILSSPSVIPFSTEWRQAAALLTEANLASFDARENIEKYMLVHPVKPGESYSALAAKYGTTIEAIKRLNGIPADNNVLRLGRRLLIYPGPWRIVVRKGPRLLELYNCSRQAGQSSDRLYAVFDVGLGRLGKTPAASFVISSKLRNPDWYSPEGGVIKYGDPENPLGNYFLKLAPTGSPDRPLLGYGIHGTQDDSDITRSLSNGCIRMRNADVETLYTIVPGRTPVEIVE
ncbi:MAG TPA: LysM peptidoglycan-binding domain-containing protein [Lentisphaeria bacterium]|uniref:L,D-transpeptidase family protein n=1 Tax=uncultured Victivallis sp. TaxID=354118 RepID=UPI000D022C50|nr:L,D-transpeptidase family protein [uncultured Victivallis sp.]AVM45271.1 hypothetical protein C5Q97_11400 [Victivallales bacterium CCUG 44730]HBP06296.1 LysM peptidoglycan-binding domain-containing protein [Lentisphaeria bacterium]HCH86126.1 LysM peptidoglycan-binding domain-containing protein [Lentisphaeria bacterium]